MYSIKNILHDRSIKSWQERLQKQLSYIFQKGKNMRRKKKRKRSRIIVEMVGVVEVVEVAKVVEVVKVTDIENRMANLRVSGKLSNTKTNQFNTNI